MNVIGCWNAPLAHNQIKQIELQLNGMKWRIWRRHSFTFNEFMNLFSYWRPWAADAMINSIDLILLNQIELNHLLVAAMPLTSPAFAVHCSFRKLKFTSWTCNSYAAALITVIIFVSEVIDECKWFNQWTRHSFNELIL